MSQEEQNENYVTPIFPLEGGEDETTLEEVKAVTEDKPVEEVSQSQIGGARYVQEFLNKHGSTLLNIFKDGYSEFRAPYLPAWEKLKDISTETGEKYDAKTFEDFKTLFTEKVQHTSPLFYIYRFLRSSWTGYSVVGFKEIEDIKRKQDFKFEDAIESTRAILLLYDIAIRLYILVYFCILSQNKFCDGNKVGDGLFKKYFKGPPLDLIPIGELFTDLEASLAPLGKCMFGQVSDPENVRYLEAVFKVVHEVATLAVWEQHVQFTKFYFFTSMSDFLTKMKGLVGGVAPEEDKGWDDQQYAAALQILYHSIGDDIFGNTLFEDELTTKLAAKAATDVGLTRDIFNAILAHVNGILGDAYFEIKDRSKYTKYKKDDFEVLKSPPDGWCFYHSLFRQTKGPVEYEKRTNDEIRGAAVPTPEQTKPFVSEIKRLFNLRPDFLAQVTKIYETDPAHPPGSFATYLNELDNEKEGERKWADPDYGIGQIAADILNADIELYQKIPGDDDNYIRIQKYEHPGATNIYKLLYVNRNHYDILLDKGPRGPPPDTVALNTLAEETRKGIKLQGGDAIKDIATLFDTSIKPKRPGETLTADDTALVAKVAEFTPFLTAIIENNADIPADKKIYEQTKAAIELSRDLVTYLESVVAAIKGALDTAGADKAVLDKYEGFITALKKLDTDAKPFLDTYPAELRGGSGRGKRKGSRKQKSSRKTRKTTHKNRKA